VRRTVGKFGVLEHEDVSVCYYNALWLLRDNEMLQSFRVHEIQCQGTDIEARNVVDVGHVLHAC
jgi:hypothetical protein